LRYDDEIKQLRQTIVLLQQKKVKT
jgi:hypothetical protein